jgi:hypothetical protein
MSAEDIYWESRSGREYEVSQFQKLRELTRLHEEIKASKNHVLKDRLAKLEWEIGFLADYLKITKS